MSEDTTIVLLKMPESGEGISFRQVLDNCSYTVTEAFAKLFKIAEEAGYKLRVDLPKQGEQFLDEGLWKTANRDFIMANRLILTPPAPEPEPDEHEAWCDMMPIRDYYGTMEIYERAMIKWFKAMPERGKGE